MKNILWFVFFLVLYAVLFAGLVFMYALPVLLFVGFLYATAGVLDASIHLVLRLLFVSGIVAVFAATMWITLDYIDRYHRFYRSVVYD